MWNGAGVGSPQYLAPLDVRLSVRKSNFLTLLRVAYAGDVVNLCLYFFALFVPIQALGASGANTTLQPSPGL